MKSSTYPTVIAFSPKIANEVMKTHDLVFAERPDILVGKIIGYDRSI